MINTTELLGEDDDNLDFELDELISESDRLKSKNNPQASESSRAALGDNKKSVHNDFDEMDRSNVGPSNPQDIDRDAEKDMFENVIPVDKIKNGASNAMQFLNWGLSNLKEQAEKFQETESYHKMNDVVLKVKERANTAYEAGKPKLKEFSENISSKAAAAYESSKPALEEFAESAKATLATAKEKVIVATEACKPSVQRAAEVANHKIESAYNETKAMIDKMSRKDE